MTSLTDEYQRRETMKNWNDKPGNGKNMPIEDPSTAERLFTPAEVARLLHVDPKTVARWAKAKKIRYVTTPGGHRRFFESDIEAIRNGNPKGNQT